MTPPMKRALGGSGPPDEGRRGGARRDRWRDGWCGHRVGRQSARALAALLGLTLGLPFPTDAAAQVAAQGPTVEEVVEALRPGQHVRLLAPGISIEDGRVVSATRDLLSVLEDAQSWEVTPALVERLAVRERDTRRTLITGAAFGAAAGFGMGYFYDKLTCQTGGGCGSAIVISAGVVGTLLGAGGGAALGYRSIHWRQRYP